MRLHPYLFAGCGVFTLAMIRGTINELFFVVRTNIFAIAIGVGAL
jgi:hypothetical protein